MFGPHICYVTINETIVNANHTLHACYISVEKGIVGKAMSVVLQEVVVLIFFIPIHCLKSALGFVVQFVQPSQMFKVPSLIKRPEEHFKPFPFICIKDLKGDKRRNQPYLVIESENVHIQDRYIQCNDRRQRR